MISNRYFLKYKSNLIATLPINFHYFYRIKLFMTYKGFHSLICLSGKSHLQILLPLPHTPSDAAPREVTALQTQLPSFHLCLFTDLVPSMHTLYPVYSWSSLIYNLYLIKASSSPWFPFIQCLTHMMCTVIAYGIELRLIEFKPTSL